MREAEAEQFTKGLTHTMCCIASRGEGDLYSDDMSEKVLDIREAVIE
jgi:hypothetical protein